MKNIVVALTLTLSLCFCVAKSFAQMHAAPTCGQNFKLKWTTSMVSDDHHWPPGKLSSTYTNVDSSGTDISISFTGETNTLGYWSGVTPKVGSQSSYLYDGIDLLTQGFSGEGITCTITFSEPIYAMSFDIHHINVSNGSGDKYTITGKDKNGNTIYPEFTNSARPTYTSDNNTGVVNAVANLTSGDNPIIGVNFADANYIKSISILWEDCDSCTPNQPHATGIGNFDFCMPQTLDFDGMDDYIHRSAFLGGQSEITMMSWIKLDNAFNGGEIMGQRNMRLYIDSEKRLKGFIKSNTGTGFNTPDLPESILDEEIWYHVTLKFDGPSGTVALYLNGDEIWKYSDETLIGTLINGSEVWNANHDFEIGRNTEFDNNYFEGAIYECRVYSKALSTTQLHQQINQEILNNNGNVRGHVVPKDIEGLLWDDLILYYKMKDIDTGNVPDMSNNDVMGRLHNMTIFQENQDFTAPLPYASKTTSNGSWTDPNNWLHGDVWTISNHIPEHAIIKSQGTLDLDTHIVTSGLIIDEGANLNIKENKGLTNSWYLKIDGLLNLEGQSQLIQTESSTLDRTSSGTLKKTLQGTADNYTYNYWSSPVGKPDNSTLNNSYTVKDVFKNVDFLATGHDGLASPLSIADYWIWKFNNGLGDNYSSWQHVRSSGKILAGEGFTMKGPGSGSITEKQSYTLQGKPNNGAIDLAVYAGNDYLIGNPYPSAIDAVQFILDNKPTSSGEKATNGTLYFWKHWGGGSHVASEYQGGYATFSLSGSVPAASNSDSNFEQSTGGTPLDLPNRYIPIGQGFYTTAETNGTLNFNNGQRLFHLEDTGSASNVLVKDITNKAAETDDLRTKLRLGFHSVNTLQRQLLITIDENASLDYDWGYDSKYIDTQIDDIYWLINNEKFIIQGVDRIDEHTIIPLGIHTKTNGFNSFNIDGLENAADDLDIYLHDKELNIYHDLKQSKYDIFLVAGQYLNRFEITFSMDNTLAIEENENKQIEVYFSNKNNKVIINNPASKLIKSVQMFNILGQTLFKFQINSHNNRLEYAAHQIKAGSYIFKIETMFGMLSKKIIIE